MKKVRILFGFFFWLTVAACAQDTTEFGRFPIVNFHHNQYRGHSQNWGIIQDSRGIIYVANNVGVLEYDGTSWREVSTNNSLVRCFATDKNGTIWVGAQDNLGFLAPSILGKTVFYSIDSLIPSVHKPYGMIRHLFVDSSNTLLAVSPNRIFAFNRRKLAVYKPKTTFHRSFFIRNRLLVNQPGYGLCILYRSKLIRLKAFNELSRKRIYSILPFNSDYLLVSTQQDGIFKVSADFLKDPERLADSISIEPFRTSDDDYLKRNRIYYSRVLSNGTFAFSTYTGGVVIINREGTVVRRINQQVGLQDNAVWYLFEDRQNNLWMALNNGISYTPVETSLTSWGRESGVMGVLKSVVEYKGRIYCSTNEGVFVKSGRHFKKVKGIEEWSWKFAKVRFDNRDTLLVGTTGGVYAVSDDKAYLLAKGKGGHGVVLIQSKFYPGIYYMGTYTYSGGIVVFQWKNNEFRYLGMLEKNLGAAIYTLAEDADGDLWFSVRYGGVGFIDMVNPYQLVCDSMRLFNLPGNPRCDDMSVSIVDGKIWAASETGLSVFSEEKQAFLPDSTLGTEFADGSTGLRIFNQDCNGDIWFEAYHSPANRWLERAKRFPNGIYRRVPDLFRTIPETIFFDVYTQKNGVSWIASTDGLFRFDERFSVKQTGLTRVLIRRVVVNRNRRLYYGARYQHSLTHPFTENINVEPGKPIQLPYSDNSLTFEFAVPYFGYGETIFYSYMLEGYESEWSEWSRVQLKEYTNLPPGKYRFLVKARNLLEEESPVQEFSFVVEKPLYLKWYAIVVYIAALIAAVWFVVALNTRLLRVSNVKLQRLADERTKELKKSEQILLEKNLVLQQQKEEILSQRDELEARNTHINDSIQYAKTIQQAILPDLSVSLGPGFEHFLVYRPKELVSGDFYWTASVGTPDDPYRKLFIAVVDCTGHGVPGAFMSLIGSRLLSEIVVERKVYNPAEILTQLNLSVNRALRQDVSESFDGMDLALVLLERKANGQRALTFSGANRPLYYYQKGEGALKTLKGNRKMIGSLLPDVDSEFSNWRITLKTGDMIFMCTDGITDQNNPERKKFASGRLHAYLLAHIDKPMERIAENLMLEFDRFKENEPQRDDITLLGIRLV